jgi:hypothetical protein
LEIGNGEWHSSQKHDRIKSTKHLMLWAML